MTNKNKKQPQIWCAHPFFSERARHLSLQQQHSRSLSSYLAPISPLSHHHHLVCTALKDFRQFSDCDDSQARQSTAATTSAPILKVEKNEVQDLLLVKTVWINCELRTGQGYGCHQHSCHFSTVNWQLYLYLSILYLYLRLWQGCHQDASLLSTAQCRLQL